MHEYYSEKALCSVISLQEELKEMEMKCVGIAFQTGSPEEINEEIVEGVRTINNDYAISFEKVTKNTSAFLAEQATKT